jgi:hypothetical protein
MSAAAGLVVPNEFIIRRNCTDKTTVDLFITAVEQKLNKYRQLEGRYRPSTFGLAGALLTFPKDTAGSGLGVTIDFSQEKAYTDGKCETTIKISPISAEIPQDNIDTAKAAIMDVVNEKKFVVGLAGGARRRRTRKHRRRSTRRRRHH